MTTLEEISALTRPDHPDDWTDLDSDAVDTVRVLAADAVQKVGNGHPGTAMSLAPLAYTLFQRTMRHDPCDTHWLGRDRFVLSGHSSLTLYLQLYLGGFGLELSDIESLRTWGSKTPGHPEFPLTTGVEITTGPLGQGLASAVGMAMASRYERGLFDPDAAPGTSPFDHHIYVIASDGDMEEGVTSEASSLAGTQQLGNLIVFYDHNHISIEDDTNIASAPTAAPTSTAPTPWPRCSPTCTVTAPPLAFSSAASTRTTSPRMSPRPATTTKSSLGPWRRSPVATRSS